MKKRLSSGQKDQTGRTYLMILPLTLMVILMLSSACMDHMFNPPVKGNGFLASEERDIPAVSSIKLEVPGSLIINQVEKPGMLITADDNIIPHIETVRIGETLHIRTRRNLRPGRNGIAINLAIPDIAKLATNGSGNIVVEDIFSPRKLSLAINGSGNIEIESLTERLTSSINGSGNLSLTGRAGEHTISIKGSGSVRAYELESADCIVKVMGSGNSYVTVTRDLDVDMMGSGNVYVNGSPAINTRTYGSGRVIKTDR